MLRRSAPQLIQRLFLPALLLMSFAFNLQLFDRFPLREDEALYSYWALSFRHEDPLMRTVWPDKPPLFIWGQAIILQLVGASQAGARFLNLAFSILTVPLVAATGRRLWGRVSGGLSALFFALNPFTISFAATSYTDPMLVFCGQMAFYLALWGKAGGAGIWLAAAIMTKQQGIFYIPLVLVTLLWVSECKGADIVRWLVGLVVVMLPILYWDSLRWAVAPSPWDLSILNYVPLTFVSTAQWGERLQQWGELLWYFGAGWWVWAGYGVLMLLGGIMGIWHTASPPYHLIGESVAKHPRSGYYTRSVVPSQTIDEPTHHRPLTPSSSIWFVLLIGWLGCMLLIHLISSVNIWDRYLLPLVPIFSLVCAGVISLPVTAGVRNQLASRMQIGWSIGMALVVILLLIPTAHNAARGGLPIGGDRGAYSGLVEAIDWLQHENKHVVLYHQRLGWHYQFYLFTALQRGDTELRWFADAAYLADNAAKIPNQNRFYIQPTWYTVKNLMFHLTTRSLLLTERARFGEMAIYEISNRPEPFCIWCLCRQKQSIPWPTHNSVE